MKGLVDLPPIHKPSPQTTSLAVIKKILDLAVQNPMRGCHRLPAPLISDRHVGSAQINWNICIWDNFPEDSG